MLRACQTLFPCLEKKLAPIEDVVDPKIGCGGREGAKQRRGRDENLTSGSVTQPALRRSVSGGRPKKNKAGIDSGNCGAPFKIMDARLYGHEKII